MNAAPVPAASGPRAAGSGPLRRCVAWLVGWLAWASTAQAWEGHEWSRWREVSTWTQPALTTDQTGRRDLAPLLALDGPAPQRITNLTAWAPRAGSYSNVLRSLLGAPHNLVRPSVEAQADPPTDHGRYTRQHLRIRTEKDDWIPAFLLVPKNPRAAKLPAVICLHQTVAQGKEEPCGIRGDPELAFAVELVERGFICLAPDAIGFGERIPAGKQPYHDSLAFYRRHPNWSFFGKMTWDVSRVIDYLETLPRVDARRIASIGHSHGAYGTLVASALEPRLAAAVASCGFTTFRDDPDPERWSHLTALAPQLGTYLPNVASIPIDWQHILALSAPRPMYVWYATRDAIFPNTSRLFDLLWDVRGVYALHGASTAIRWQTYEGDHRFPRNGRESAYRWLEDVLSLPPDSAPPLQPPAKTASTFFPSRLVEQARHNAEHHPWAAAIRDPLVKAAAPWLQRSDEELWNGVFDHTVRRAWQVWSDGHCPACKEPVPMYEWQSDALAHPWKLRCPHCRQRFPKNDFAAFYRSGLKPNGRFDVARADRSLLFNTEHPDSADPLHRFGVDDGEGFVDQGHRWRFIGAYLIYGQWKQAIVGGIRNLAAAYVATGDRRYARKAAVLLDRVADIYPDYDFATEGVMYEGPPRSGYVSTWHDACVEVLDLALAYDQIFEALGDDVELHHFLARQAANHRLPNPKTSFADIQRNIEERIFRDTLRNRFKIESNYPSTDVTIVTLRSVLDWSSQRAEILRLIDDIVRQATAVDGLTGEKGITGYSVIAPHAVADLLGRYARSEPGFVREMVRRHPALHAMYRFHLDTLCLGHYYPRTGDSSAFAERSPGYAGLAFTRNPGLRPSSFSFLRELYQATGDVDFARLVHQANDRKTDGLPFDLFDANPEAFQSEIRRIVTEHGAEIALPSVNKTAWGLAILRSGQGPHARAVWLDYDSGERHGHADGLTMGLFAEGLDLLPDFGYPPVQYGGWTAPRAVWYTQTAAHNTASIDGRNTRPGTGTTTLWFDGQQLRTVRAAAANLTHGSRFERTLALIDISPTQAYVLDVLRLAGGKEHVRRFHGTFGRLSTEGLALANVPPPPATNLLRILGRDPHAPNPWQARWHVEDRFRYQPDSPDVQLTLHDLTGPTETETAESWVALGMFNGTAEAWVPSVLTRRRSERPGLASTFLAVLEPHAGQPALTSARRLPLVDAQGRPSPETSASIEIQLRDGRRDLFLIHDPEAPSTIPLASPENDAQLEGDLAWIRFSPSKEPERAVMCRARSLKLGALSIRSTDPTASFEIDLRAGRQTVVTGPKTSIEIRRGP